MFSVRRVWRLAALTLWAMVGRGLIDENAE
jgi:hypothetical protein